MILHRIAGGRQTGKTTFALRHLRFAQGGRCLYIGRNASCADAAARDLCRETSGRRWRRYEVEWPNHVCHFTGASQNFYQTTIGRDFQTIVLDCKFFDLHPTCFGEFTAKGLEELIVVSSDPWTRDMRAWLRFRDALAGAFDGEILTACLPGFRQICTRIGGRAPSRDGSK